MLLFTKNNESLKLSLSATSTLEVFPQPLKAFCGSIFFSIRCFVSFLGLFGLFGKIASSFES